MNCGGGGGGGSYLTPPIFHFCPPHGYRVEMEQVKSCEGIRPLNTKWVTYQRKTGVLCVCIQTHFVHHLFLCDGLMWSSYREKLNAL